MSLNFSIDSILRHSNVEPSNSMIGSGKLNQAAFLDESTSAFLKKQLNSHQQLNNYLNATTNGTSPTSAPTTDGLNANSNQLLINETTPNSTTSLLQPLFYLNKAAATNTTAALSLMDTLQTNGSSTPNHTGHTGNNTSSSAFAFELNQLQQLNPLNPLELSRLNQLTQFQLNQFQSQLVVPYLSKINSLYNESTAAGQQAQSSALRANSIALTNCLNSNASTNARPNSNHHAHHLNSINHHNLPHHHHKSSINENSSSASAKHHQQAALFGLANGALFGSNSGFNTTESQCSPLSDKSCEMLTYEDDSMDSNRMSQHSGNNVSINSSVSNPNKQLNSLNSSNNKDAPLCTKCKLHGIRNQVKGHKKNCPKKDCMCELCILTDIGKRLRGKKGKKAGTGPAAAAGIQLPGAATLTPANLLMMESLSETNNLNNLGNLNGVSLLAGSSVANLHPQPHHHPSTTPNSNSNSSCSNLSMSTALTASLRSHQPQTASVMSSTSSSTNSTIMLNQQLTNLHSGLGFLEKATVKDYMKIVISLLKEKLAQDGLDYEQELSKLKYTVIYLLLNRFDNKVELFNKFISDA